MEKPSTEPRSGKDDELKDQISMDIARAAAEVPDDASSTEPLEPERKQRLATTIPLILGNELCERLAYYGLSTNMIVYMTGQLSMSNANASAMLNIWSGTCYITPLLGAFLADSFMGRFWVIIAFSMVYLVGTSLLTVSAAVPALRPEPDTPPGAGQLAAFWTAMYLIALGTGGIKPCVSSFGADQFQESKPTERRLRSKFFNYFYFCINVGSLIASLAIVYVQENVSWAWGFAIPAFAFALAISLFASGSTRYRRLPPAGSPFTRLWRTCSAAAAKRKLPLPNDPYDLWEVASEESAIHGTRKIEHSAGLRCIDHAAIRSNDPKLGRHAAITVTHCEEVKAMVNLLPLLATNIVFQVVYNQMSTLFVLQGTTMERSIGSIQIPSASMSFVNTVAVMVCVLIYDMLIVPGARRWRGRPISLLQRIGWGYVVAALAMVVAALVEVARLNVVAAYGLQSTDYEVTPVPMSIWWQYVLVFFLQVPQYFLVGAAEVLTNIGCLELFYSSSPDSMRSTAMALYLLGNGLSGYITSALVLAVQAATDGGQDGAGWISDNLNTSHMDYFFWLLAVLQVLDLLAYVPIAYWFKPPVALGAVPGVQQGPVLHRRGRGSSSAGEDAAGAKAGDLLKAKAGTTVLVVEAEAAGGPRARVVTTHAEQV